MIDVGLLVVVNRSFYVQLKRTALGLRPSPDVTVHDDSSPGLVFPEDILLVLRVCDDIVPHRHNEMCTADIMVLTPRATVGWIYDNLLRRVDDIY